MYRAKFWRMATRRQPERAKHDSSSDELVRATLTPQSALWKIQTRRAEPAVLRVIALGDPLGAADASDGKCDRAARRCSRSGKTGRVGLPTAPAIDSRRVRAAGDRGVSAR